MRIHNNSLLCYCDKTNNIPLEYYNFEIKLNNYEMCYQLTFSICVIFYFTIKAIYVKIMYEGNYFKNGFNESVMSYLHPKKDK